MSKLLGHDLGSYLREQRVSAQLSLRQLADLSGISNPYLSQIERGLKKPSAEILQQIARALQVSAESLYVRAGILEAREPGASVRAALAADPRLNDRQREILIDVYESFVGVDGEGPADAPAQAAATEQDSGAADLADAPAPAAPAGPAGRFAARPGGASSDEIEDAPAQPAPVTGETSATPVPRKAPRATRKTTRRRKQSALAAPTAAALTTRRPTPPRHTNRGVEKE